MREEENDSLERENEDAWIVVMVLLGSAAWFAAALLAFHVTY